MNTTQIAMITCLGIYFGNAFAQSVEKDPAAIVELGAATGWNVKGGAATFAPDIAVEVTPIENRLELELGTAPFFARNKTEWDTALLFKSLGPSLRKLSSCSVLARSGFTPARTGRLQIP
jgi:hypothetical protein